MTRLADLSTDKLAELKNELEAKIEYYKNRKLSLNMTRGVPDLDQLKLSNDMISCLFENDYLSEDGMDCRNYGGVDGLVEMKRMFADLLEVETDNVIVGGNSSLSMMFDSVASNMTHGVRDGEPWQHQGEVKFLCPSPGYDRHFAITDYFHIKMIPIDMKEDGPDMDTIEKLVSSDPMIKGIWCVPKYSNPTGIVYSDETVRRFANLKPAAADFRIYWDNAYAFHHLTGKKHKILNILHECEKSGNPNMVYIFSSFSKVSFAGAAVACMASSVSNCDYIRKRLSIQTIGPDKLTQLRHVRFFKNAEGVREHMERHTKLLYPKFTLVINKLNDILGKLDIADWSNPEGGYFVNFNSMDGCAKDIVELCSKLGVALTPAGSTFPYGIDPRDRNIRIAPTCPPLNDLITAMDVFCAAVIYVSVEKLLSGRDDK